MRLVGFPQGFFEAEMTRFSFVSVLFVVFVSVLCCFVCCFCGLLGVFCLLFFVIEGCLIIFRRRIR